MNDYDLIFQNQNEMTSNQPKTNITFSNWLFGWGGGNKFFDHSLEFNCKLISGFLN